jgi:DNA repair exonuclease SbcCD ATPase subunit
MQETLIWVLMLLAEGFLLSSGILGFLLWRARKLQRRLRAEIAALQRVSQEGMPPVPAHSIPSPAIVSDAELAETAEEQPDTADINAVVAILDDRSMDESMGRFEETKKALLQQIEALEMEQALAQQDQQRLAVLRYTLQQMSEELETLRYAHTRMQRDLQNKKVIMKRTMEESDLLYKQRVSLQSTVREIRSANAHLSSDLEIKDRLLKQLKAESQEQQQLRGEVRALKTRLAARETEVEHLQAEKESMAEEYAVLSKEYERMYASFLK